MEGLEATEIRFSALDESFRIDAEYYRPELLHLDEAIRSRTNTILERAGHFVSGPFGSDFLVDNYDRDSKFRYVRGKDVKPFFVADTDNVYLPSRDYKRLEDYALQREDVLISVVGTLGNASIVTEDVLPAIFSSKSTVFRSSSLNSWFLTAYLNSRFGRSLLLRGTRGTVQTGLNLPDLRSLIVPVFANSLETMIADVVKRSYAELGNSKALYTRAETLLLDALGLRDWQPPQPLTYEQRASAAFEAGRLDAEHFQPQYAALFALLKQKGDLRLGDHLTEKVRRGISPEYVEDGDVVVINSRHVGKTQVEVEANRYTTRTLLNVQPEARGEVVVGDVLLNSTGRDTIGRCQCVLENVEAVVDNHIAIIRPTSALDPVYLACFLNALPGQMQTERSWTGSSGQIELRPDSIEDYRVWNAPPELQQEVRTMIEQSHAARRQAKHLLEAAKRAVEIAIEESEGAALAFLEHSRASERGTDEP